jgi:hypothetical protein
MRNTLWIAVGLALATLGSASTASAVVIYSQNFDGVSANTPPGVDTAGAGFTRSDAHAFIQEDTSGTPGAFSAPNLVYINGLYFAGSGNTSVTSSSSVAAVAADTDYTLSLRLAIPAYDLFGGGNAGGEFLNLSANNVFVTPTSITQPALTVGSWVEWTRTYSAATMADYVGQPLTISFGIQNGGGARTQFDNVTLTAVPEPSSLGMLAVGAVGIGIGVIAKKRRK